MDTIFNTDGCFYRALDDEPIFVLLARDPCFAETIRGWETSRQALIGRGEKPQGDHPMLLEALATATAGVAWRNESTHPANGYDAGQHARWHVEKAPERKLVEVVLHPNKSKGAPTGGYMLPYHEWLTVERSAMPLGNRFLIGDIERELVFWENENYRQPALPPKWTGYYPINHSLQKDMLWCAYEDWRNKAHQTVSAIKRLAGGEVPTYANILRRANELGTEGCPSELLTKYLLTFADDNPVTFYAGDIRKALEALRRERDLAGRPKTIKYFENAEDEDGREVTPMSLNRIAEMLDYATVYGEWDENTPNGATTGLAGEPMNDYRRNAIVLYKKVLGVLPEDYVATRPETVKQTSGAGEIDPAKEALWIDMAEERGFLSAEDAEKARAALPAGTKAAIPGKHLIFIVRDLAKKIATGLRQVTTDIDGSLEAHKNHGDDYCGHHSDLERWIDRINGYAAELEAGEAEAARFRSRPIRMHPALGMPYEPSGVPQGDVYKRFASLIDYQEMTVEDARKIVEDFRKRFPDVLRVYEGLPPLPTDEIILDTLERKPEIAELLRRAMTEPQGRWTGAKINPAQYAKGGTVKAESDTLDVTDTPEMPPHRFTMFTKARGWAYGRGLEINPAHIPDMLDRMDKDGWHLQAVFGGVEPTKVGMLFKRVEMVTVDMEYYWRPTYPPSVAEMMAAPTEGVDDPPPPPAPPPVRSVRDGIDVGRGLEP